MQTLFELYQSHLRKKSDISRHLEILSRLASLCNEVTEFGVRDGSSTSAFLYGRPQRLTSYDIKPFLKHDLYCNAAVAEGVAFEFIQMDTIKMSPIRATDLLFIDTLHTYGQLKMELAIHAPMVSKYLIFHDTSTYGDRGQNGEAGLWLAISEYLKTNPCWSLWHYYTHNHGLTILRRDRQE